MSLTIEDNLRVSLYFLFSRRKVFNFMITCQVANKKGIQMGYLEDFEVALKNHDAPALLRLWEEYTSSDEVDAEDFKSILQVVKESELADYIGRHIERSLPLWEKARSSPFADEILRLIVDLQISNTELLRELAFDYLETKYKNDPYHNEKMRLSAMRSKNEPFKGAISNYELLNHLKKGNFVFHTGGWGVGEVVEISFIREQASFEFDYVAGKKDISFKNAFNCLIPIPNTHFLALRFGKPDELEEKAKKDPVEVIHWLLRDLGPKTAAEIKDELCELVIPEKDWTRWWQTTRGKIKKDILIQSPDELSQPFRLSRKEISHEERLQKALEHKPDANTLIQMVYSFLKDFPETIKNAPFKNSLVEKLSELLTYSEITEAQLLQVHFFLKDLSPEKEYPLIADLLRRSEKIEETVKEIAIQAFKKRALAEIQKTRDDWKTLFLNLIFVIDQGHLRDYILNELIAKENATVVKNKIEDLCAHPSQFPEAFVWYFQKIMEDSSLPFANKEGRSRFFESFLILLSYLEGTGEHRDLIKKIHGILSEGRFVIVRKIMKDSSVKDVQEFLLLVTKCHSLSDHDIKIFHSLAEVAHTSLAKKTKKTEEAEAEDQTIWTTQEGYQKLQRRIEQIATVETVENAKEIEVARAHGDLRENAEFKSALEKRDRLQGELKFLSGQLNHCRILTKDDISTDKVGIGVIVDCKKKSGEIVSYTLLGPWDADVDQNILSFQSKLAKTMSGLKVGDKFQVQGVEHTISKIQSYL